MFLPRTMHGTLKRARANAKKAADLVTKKGVRLDDAINASDGLDTSVEPGLILLSIAMPAPVANEPHFHPGLMFDELWSRKLDGALGAEESRRVFQEALGSLHGLLSLQANAMWMWSGIKPWEIPVERRSSPVRARIDVNLAHAFIERFAEVWDQLDAEGERYSRGVPVVDVDVVERGSPGFVVATPRPSIAARLWKIGGATRDILYNLGVPDREFVRDQPEGGLRGLLSRHAGICDARD